jgi:2-keto-3-deoxy-L-rhamnonate aldolase RhmA
MKPKATAPPPGFTENPLQARLRRGEPVLGAVITLNSPEVAAHLAGLGFDFLWFEMEHSPVTLEGLRNMILATRGLGAVPLARPPVNELWTAKCLLDVGALGVIFPFTRTPDLARQAVAACRYPPTGLRGSGAMLAQMRWPPAADYYDFADRNVLVVAVVEDTSAVEHIEDIAATPGLDVLFIGTSDLSFSLGLRGQQQHPKLDAAIAKITAAARRNGKPIGRPAGSATDIRRFRKQGFQFFMTATDLELITSGAAQLLGPLKRSRGQAPSVGL